jgi:hypothetical protein
MQATKSVKTLISSTLKMEAARSFEISVYNKRTRRHSPEDSSLHSHGHENQKSYPQTRLQNVHNLFCFSHLVAVHLQNVCTKAGSMRNWKINYKLYETRARGEAKHFLLVSPIHEHSVHLVTIHGPQLESLRLVLVDKFDSALQENWSCNDT